MDFIRLFEMYYFLNGVNQGVIAFVFWKTGLFCVIRTHCQDSPSHAIIFYKLSSV